MEVSFANDELERLAHDAKYFAAYPHPAVKKYRMRIQLIRAAVDERDFYEMKSLHFEKLKGKRKHQRSMKLNDQWRLVMEIKKGEPKNSVLIASIEDYH